MSETRKSGQTRREKLRAQRDLLFERFSENPSEIHLAREIKSIDDQVAETLFHYNGRLLESETHGEKHRGQMKRTAR